MNGISNKIHPKQNMELNNNSNNQTENTNNVLLIDKFRRTKSNNNNNNTRVPSSSSSSCSEISEDIDLISLQLQEEKQLIDLKIGTNEVTILYFSYQHNK